MMFVAKAFGWIYFTEASNAQVALSQAKAAAPGASLLSTDIQSVHLASKEDMAWYHSMSGETCGVGWPD